MAPFLPSASLPDFLTLLSTYGDVHGPVRTADGIVAFRPLTNFSDLLLHLTRTLLPPKKYLLPPRETIMLHDRSGYRPAPSPTWKTILVGLHPCDLAGISYLDRVFLGELEDRFYAGHRQSLFLVGTSCKPDQFCFCGTLQGAERRCDIFLEESEEGFHLEPFSATGQAIVEQSKGLLSDELRPERYTCPSLEEEAIREAAARGETFDESPLWDEFSRRCLSCGACSLCCPTCYCYDVREYGGPGAEEAERLREWDNCLFHAHGEVAGGHNFRPTRQERFRYRFRHKYLGFGPTRGMVSCVGCGRCREVCPVEIDLLELFFPEGKKGDGA